MPLGSPVLYLHALEIIRRLMVQVICTIFIPLGICPLPRDNDSSNSYVFSSVSNITFAYSSFLTNVLISSSSSQFPLAHAFTCALYFVFCLPLPSVSYTCHTLHFLTLSLYSLSHCNFNQSQFSTAFFFWMMLPYAFLSAFHSSTFPPFTLYSSVSKP